MTIAEIQELRNAVADAPALASAEVNSGTVIALCDTAMRALNVCRLAADILNGADDDAGLKSILRAARAALKGKP